MPSAELNATWDRCARLCTRLTQTLGVSAMMVSAMMVGGEIQSRPCAIFWSTSMRPYCFFLKHPVCRRQEAAWWGGGESSKKQEAAWERLPTIPNLTFKANHSVI